MAVPILEHHHADGHGTKGDYGSLLNGEKNENQEEEDDATYLKLLKTNRAFRLYMLSYVITHVGEWLTYIASIALAEELLAQQGISSRTTISILVVARLLPNVLLSPFGGILADGRDRRESMIVLDLMGAITPLLFLLALKFQSIPVIYWVTFLQNCIAGLYEPCRSSIIPQMVPEEKYLKKATTLAGLAWSIFAAIGSSLGGLVVTWFGFNACFLLDCVTYLTSAYCMYLVGGTWNVSPEQNESKVTQSVWDQIRSMLVDGFFYLRGSFFGPLVFLKASGGIIYGAGDVLNVSFSEPNGMGDRNSPARLGLLFACVGIGCVLGPLMADRYTDMKRPASLQKVCILAMATTASGFFAIAIFHPFWTTCLFTLLKSMGSCVNWIDSSLLLQKFSSDEMMGRVLAVDYGLALLGEVCSAYVAGYLQDELHLGAHQVALVLSLVGFGLVLAWSLYHMAGLGAAAAPSEEAESKQETRIGERLSLVGQPFV